MERKLNGVLSSESGKQYSVMANKVFDIVELREMILDYVIHDKKGVLISNVRSCRLVNKSWLRSTSRILLMCGEPLFQLKLCKESYHQGYHGSRGNPEPRKQGDLLDQFLMSYGGELRLDDRVPPHKIKTEYDFLQNKNYQRFFNCLDSCGSGLIELDLLISEALQQIPFNENISFPRLKKIDVFLSQSRALDTAGNSENTIDLIHPILNATSKLKIFELGTAELGPMPNSLSNLVLPPSITKLTFDCMLHDSNLDTLVRNPLPNLISLKFCVSETPFKDGLVTDFLDSVRKTLVNLSVGEEISRPNPDKRTTKFQLPHMERLESLKIETAYLELKENLQELVPTLKHLTLKYHTCSMFRKWVDGSCFNSERSLELLLVSNDYYDTQDDEAVGFDRLTREALRGSCTNLLELDVALPWPSTRTVQCIWRNMTNLRCLKIRVENTPNASNNNSDLWDSLLIGVPLRSVAALKTNPDLWEKLQAQSNVSIRNLTVLHTLDLYAYWEPDEPCRCCQPYNRFYPLMSEAAFHFAFLKMPNLVNLSCTGHFSVTQEIVEMWENAGRIIDTEYYDNSDSEDTDSEYSD